MVEEETILIIGGAYQGKLTYALETFSLAKRDVYTFLPDGDITMDMNCRIFYQFEYFILNLVKQNIEPVNFLKKNEALFAGKIIICCDISLGIVPVDSEMRLWRESTGKALTYLSSRSNSIIRLFCGIAAVIK